MDRDREINNGAQGNFTGFTFMVGRMRSSFASSKSCRSSQHSYKRHSTEWVLRIVTCASLRYGTQGNAMALANKGGF
jgi:hypothetical protein